jgi:hypothetical protein
MSVVEHNISGQAPIFRGRSVDDPTVDTVSFTVWFLIFVTAMVVALLIALARHLHVSIGDPVSFASCIAVGVVSLTGLYFASFRYVYSLNIIHWIFFVFFMFYSPLVQHLTGLIPPQANLGYQEHLFVFTNDMLLVWMAVYAFTYSVTSKSLSRRTDPILPTRTKDPNYGVLCLLSIIGVLLVIAVLGFHSLYSRGELIKQMTSTEDTALSNIANSLGRSVSALALMLILLRPRKKTPDYWAYVWFTGILCIVANSPLGVARFWFGSIVLGFLTLFVRRLFRRGVWLPVLLFAAFLTILPLLNLLRFHEVNDVDTKKNYAHDLISTVTGNDFDAYSMFVDTIAYVKDAGTTNGNQFLETVLSIVPRKIWKDKPYNSGMIVAERYNMVNLNMSCPLPAEGYINWGPLGVVIFAIMFGAIAAVLDTRYWLRTLRAPGDTIGPTLLELAYPFLIGLSVFILRGALGTTITNAMGFVFAAWLVYSLGNSSLLRVPRGGQISND